MKYIFLTILLTFLLSSSSLISDETPKVGDVILQKKPVKDYTNEEIIYIASFIFGHRTSKALSSDPLIKINFDKFIEGFKKRMSDKTLKLNPAEIATVKDALNKAKTEKKSPSQDIVDKLSYMNGVNNGNQFSTSPLSLNKESFILGIMYVKNKKEFKLAEDIQKEIFSKVQELYNEEIGKEEKKFFEKNAKKEGVISLKNGLQYKVLKKGKGEVFSEGQTADVHYEGRLIDGTIFDSSYKRGQTFNVGYKGRVIKGWQEILTIMKEGDQWEVYIPSKMAYGARGQGSIKPNSVLIFKMEVVKIKK